MKKFLALLLALVMALSLAACGGNNTPADDQQGDNNGDSQYPEYFAGMEDLIADAQAEGELVVYGSCEEEYLAAACQHFEDLFGIKTTYQRLSTGEVQAKIEEENGNPSADVWFGGTTDPYNMCAAEGLLEPYEAVNASHLISDMYKDADNNWFGIYKGILGFMVNTDELARLNQEAPADWADLLKEEYKGEIWLSNYNTAGTAKLVVNTMIQKMGHDEGIQYLVDLDKNIEVYTKSGSGPSKSAVHSNAAKLWIEYALSPECVELAAKNGSYQFLVIDNAEQPSQASEFGLDPDNVMEYDFEDAKANTATYVEEVMNALAAAGANTTDTGRFQTE